MARRTGLNPVAAAYLDGLVRPQVQLRDVHFRDGSTQPLWGILHGGRFYPCPSFRRALELATHRAHWNAGQWIPRSLYPFAGTSTRRSTR